MNPSELPISHVERAEMAIMEKLKTAFPNWTVGIYSNQLGAEEEVKKLFAEVVIRPVLLVSFDNADEEPDSDYSSPTEILQGAVMCCWSNLANQAVQRSETIRVAQAARRILIGKYIEGEQFSHGPGIIKGTGWNVELSVDGLCVVNITISVSLVVDFELEFDE